MRIRYLLSRLSDSMNLWSRSFNILKQGLKNLQLLIYELENSEHGSDEGNEKWSAILVGGGGGAKGKKGPAKGAKKPKKTAKGKKGA